jgi:hypothetical protein
VVIIIIIKKKKNSDSLSPSLSPSQNHISLCPSRINDIDSVAADSKRETKREREREREGGGFCSVYA